MKIFKSGLIFGICLVVLGSNIGLVIAEPARPATTTAPKAVATTADSDKTTVVDPAKIKERADRRAIDFKIKLDKTQETRLKFRCKASQAVLVKAKARSVEIKTRRLQHYSNVSEKVAGLVEKLKATGANTDELSAAQALIAPQVLALSTAFTEYQQALDDSINIDCVTYPIAFKASLEAARAQHELVGKAYIALRKAISDNLQPALVNAKKTIESSKKETK